MSNCKICNVVIEDEVLKHTYYDEDYPDIDIGPYCIDCLPNIRMCSSCHTPHVLDVSIRYFGEGKYYCTECAQNIEVCDHCERERSIYKTVDGNKYCSSCYSENFFTCSCCEEDKLTSDEVSGPLIRKRKATLFRRYKKICQPCFDKVEHKYKTYDVTRCKRCERMYTKNESSHDSYCASCVERIPPCGDCVELDHNVRNKPVVNAEGNSHINRYLCSSCFSKYKKCDCGRWDKKLTTRKGKRSTKDFCRVCAEGALALSECPSCLKWEQLGSHETCGSCRSLYEENKCNCGMTMTPENRCRSCEPHSITKILNYSYTPHLHFNYDEKDDDPIFFGIENESSFINSSRKMEKGIRSIYSRFDTSQLLLKSDGTISGYGFELVTQPMTLDYFSKMPIQYFFPEGIKFSTSCGMHVHVNRDAFISDLHIYKIVNFIHEYKDFVVPLVGRDAGGYNNEFKHKVSKTVSDSKKGRGPGKYMRVNLSRNNTIEFRMFAGAVREFEMRYRIEFLHALITFSKTASHSEVTPDGLTKYVMSINSVRRYPNLYKYLVNKGGN